MNIAIRKAGPATILDLNGALRLGASEELFRKQVQQLLNSGTSQFAVNLSGVTDIDSSGVGTLLRMFMSIQRSGGKCIFFSPNKRVMMLLKMVRLDSALDLAEDEAAALTRV